MAESLSDSIQAAWQDNHEFLEHVVHQQAKTSTHTSQASEILAENVVMQPLNILDPLRQYYVGIIGADVLDFVPVTERGRWYFKAATHLLRDPCGLGFHEINESEVNAAHLFRIRIALRATCGILFEVATLKKAQGADIDLEEVSGIIRELKIFTKEMLTDDVFCVHPDASLTSRTDDSHNCLMPLEDKVSTGLGWGKLIDFDRAQEGEVPNKTTMHAIKQVYTQVALAGGSLGLLTGLRNGTWVCGHKEEPRRILYATKNLTLAGVDDVERLKILLEAEILCFLYVIHDTEKGKKIFSEPCIDIFPRSCAKRPLPWCSCIENVMLFMWTMLSVLFLQITGPSLLRTRWINLHLWTSEHSVPRLRAEHTTNSCFQVPLLLKTGQELGRGAHGIVKAIRGMNLVIKIGMEDDIRHEASFYLRARSHRNLPMVADFGAFNIDGSDGCALVLELATPVDEASVDPYEISKALEALTTRLHIHHHDICLANMVRGVTDKKLKIIDFAKAVDAEDCNNCCDNYW